jgi:hypothetical protein
MPKCSECGLLSVRDKFTTEIVEVLKLDRETGWHQNKNSRKTPAELYCHKGSEAFAVTSNNPPEIAEQVGRENTCLQFMIWQNGLTAKEHAEMEFLQKVEQAHARHRAEDAETARVRFRAQELRSWIALGVSILALVVSAIVATYNWPK